jgi:hypothetical protein
MTASTSEARTRILEDGFLHPADRRLESADNGSHNIPLLGLMAPLQYFRVQVGPGGDDGSLSYIVVFETMPPFRPEDLATLASFWVERTNSILVLAAHQGAGRVAIRRGPDDDHRAIVSAVATVLASASWDESDPIVVDVQANRFAVKLTFDAGWWRSTISVLDSIERAR